MQARLLAAACFGQVRTSGYGSSGAATEPLPGIAEGLNCLGTDGVDRTAQAEPELVQWQHEDQNAHDREQHALHSEPQLCELVEARRNRLGQATFAICSFESMAESTPPSGAFTIMP